MSVFGKFCAGCLSVLICVSCSLKLSEWGIFPNTITPPKGIIFSSPFLPDPKNYLPVRGMIFEAGQTYSGILFETDHYTFTRVPISLRKLAVLYNLRNAVLNSVIFGKPLPPTHLSRKREYEYLLIESRRGDKSCAAKLLTKTGEVFCSTLSHALKVHFQQWIERGKEMKIFVHYLTTGKAFEI